MLSSNIRPEIGFILVGGYSFSRGNAFLSYCVTDDLTGSLFVSLVQLEKYISDVSLTRTRIGTVVESGEIRYCVRHLMRDERRGGRDCVRSGSR